MEKYLVVGLGNPGLRYRHTRHNMGFMVIDYLSEKNSIKLNKTKAIAKIGESTIEGVRLILAKPQTYMNNSGESVIELMNYFSVDPAHLIVIYDDMDLEMGTIRIRKKGSSGSHNGMRSIIYHLQCEDFIRIRLGIGEKQQKEAKAHVLSTISKEERETAFEAIKKSGEATLLIIKGQMDNAMNRYSQ